MAPWLKLPLVTKATHLEIKVQVLAAILPIQVHDNMSGETEDDGLSTCVHARCGRP